MAKELFHHLSTEQAFDALRSSANGLSSAEATERLNAYGPNTIPESAKRSWLLLLLNQFKSLLIGILAIAAIISWITDHQVDMYVIIGIILINALVGFVQEYRAEKAVEALRNMLAPSAKVKRDGQVATIAAEKLCRAISSCWRKEIVSPPMRS